MHTFLREYFSFLYLMTIAIHITCTGHVVNANLRNERKALLFLYDFYFYCQYCNISNCILSFSFSVIFSYIQSLVVSIHYLCF